MDLRSLRADSPLRRDPSRRRDKQRWMRSGGYVRSTSAMSSSLKPMLCNISISDPSPYSTLGIVHLNPKTFLFPVVKVLNLVMKDGSFYTNETFCRVIDEVKQRIGVGQIVSGVGRGIALDRDGNYNKTKRAYDAFVCGVGKKCMVK